MPRSAVLTVGTVLALVPLGLADARTKPTLTAPSSAKLRSTFKVVVKNLKPDRYAVRLFGTNPADSDQLCVARLVPQAKRKISSLTVKVKMPATLRCFTFPEQYTETIPVKAGQYRLVVSVPTSESMTAARGNVVIHKLTLHA